MDIINANIVIGGVEDTGQQIKIKDQNKKTYSFFKTKKDGGTTKAYEQFQQYKIGEEVGISYKEVAFTGRDGTPGKIKNIINFNPVHSDAMLARNGAKAAPRANFSATEPVKPPMYEVKEARNWEKEAYEKCCSIWAAQLIANGSAISALESGIFWQLFQAIKKDGEKRFSTGWDKAVKTFGADEPEGPEAPPIEAYEVDADKIPF